MWAGAGLCGVNRDKFFVSAQTTNIFWYMLIRANDYKMINIINVL